MKRLVVLLFIFFIIGGCSAPPEIKQPSNVTEEQIRSAITELINGINNGNIEVVQKYVGNTIPIAEQLAEKLKNNIKLHNIGDISIEGTTASATVTLEVVPLNMKKDIILNFDIANGIIWDNPVGLLSLLVQ